MVDASEPPPRPRKGTGKPRSTKTPKAIKAAPVDQPADALMDELSRDLLTACEEAFGALSSIGLAHVSPALSRDRLGFILIKERDAVITAHRNNDPDRHVRYGVFKQVLADLRDGRPLVLPFGVPRRAGSAPVAPGAAAAQATVSDVLQQMAALDKSKPSPATASASYGYALGSRPNPATGYNPHPASPRRPVNGPEQPAQPDTPPETQADGGAGHGPPPPPPGLPARPFVDPEREPDRRQGATIDWRKSIQPDRLKGRARETVIRHRRTILRTTRNLVILSVLCVMALGAATFWAIVSGVAGGMFSVLTTWAVYRLVAGLGAILMLAWLMELTPSEVVSPPRNAWLPAILGLVCAIYALGGTQVIEVMITDALNTPLDSVTLKSLAAMAALSLGGVFLVRWYGNFPESPDFPDDLEPLPAFEGIPGEGRGFGRYGRRAFKEKKPFGDPGIGGDSDGDDKDKLGDVLSGKRGGFYDPKFGD